MPWARKIISKGSQKRHGKSHNYGYVITFLFFRTPRFCKMECYSISSISSPQQTRVPPPAFVTTTSFPQILHLYFSPVFSTPIGLTSCNYIIQGDTIYSFTHQDYAASDKNLQSFYIQHILNFGIFSKQAKTVQKKISPEFTKQLNSLITIK